MEVRTFGSADALIDALKDTLPDAICLDIGLPGVGGMEALRIVRSRHRTVPVIMLTADGSVDSVVEAMNHGAYDYVQKPASRARLVPCIRNAAAHHRATTELAQLTRSTAGAGFPGIVGASPAMGRLFGQLEKVAASDITVLVHGESGTGKELVARAIHRHSARRDAPFVAINCAAVPESLQDSAFFGHEKGAFTGATRMKPGHFEMAHGGTLFLDEVAELSLSLQAKLLRVLQERRFERVGGTRTLSSDFRLVAASHRDLAAMVKEGTFRGDLFFRLAVLELEVPPLREREGDMERLIHAFFDGGTGPMRIDAAAMKHLRDYDWPGNVRELHNVLERAAVLCRDSCIRFDDLPDRIRNAQGGPERGRAPVEPPASALPASGFHEERPDLADPQGVFPGEAQKGMTLAELERWAIETAMARTGGNLSEVVRILAIGRTTLYRKLKSYRSADDQGPAEGTSH